VAYTEADTTATLIQRIAERLKLEGVDTGGRDPVAIARALNEAARHVTGELARYEVGELRYSVTRTVARGDAAVLLPDGTVTTPAAPRALKLLEAVYQATAGVQPTPLRVCDPREANDEPELAAPGSFALAREHLSLRWLSTTGAPAAGTVTLRYLAALAAVDSATPTVKPFELLAPEWTDVILDLATARLTPSKAGTAGRYEARGSAALEEQLSLQRRFVHTGAARIRRV